jgi:ATP-dependent Lhr-like helicase
VVVDEIHAFATQKRGDLLALALVAAGEARARLRRVGLSATVADPDAYRAWLAPHGDMDAVSLVRGDPAPSPTSRSCSRKTSVCPGPAIPAAGPRTRS